MTPDEIRARFRGVVARAMAKPLSELPYRAPVTSRFHHTERQWSIGMGPNPRGTAALVRLNTGRKSAPGADRRWIL